MTTGRKMRINPRELNRHKAHDIITDIVAPRPIAFVSTIGEDGVYNLAPFSYFTPMCNAPMIVGFSIGSKADGKKKDTLLNIVYKKEFVIGVVTESIARPMVKTAAALPIHIDEFEKSGLTPVRADLVAPPLVAESPVNMECRLKQIIHFDESPNKTDFVVGEVLQIHIADDVIENDQIDASRLKLVARLGGKGKAYCRSTDIFTISRSE
jgi:flavin reductase (DIM6/NTAB) family NADH-FMN oxidoreductase RutF